MTELTKNLSAYKRNVHHKGNSNISAEKEMTKISGENGKSNTMTKVFTKGGVCQKGTRMNKLLIRTKELTVKCVQKYKCVCIPRFQGNR